MHSGQRNEAKRALQDIQSKHQDVLRIEKSIIVHIIPFLNLGTATIIHGSKCFACITR